MLVPFGCQIFRAFWESNGSEFWRSKFRIKFDSILVVKLEHFGPSNVSAFWQSNVRAF